MKIFNTFFLCLALTFWSCSTPIDEADLIGLWQVTECKTTSESASPDLISMGDKNALENSYELKVDQSLIVHQFPHREPLSGTWKYDADRQKVELKYENPYSEQYDSNVAFEIESLTDKELVWVQDVGIARTRMVLGRR